MASPAPDSYSRFPNVVTDIPISGIAESMAWAKASGAPWVMVLPLVSAWVEEWPLQWHWLLPSRSPSEWQWALA